MTRERFHAFWSGPPLSIYEELSLASIAAHGHPVSLWTYDAALRVPASVDRADANEIVPGGQVHQFVHPTGARTPALHSDIFRYSVLRRHGGWWFDLDIVMLCRTAPSDAIYLAREDSGTVNGAILKLPSDAPLLADAVAQAQAPLGQASWGAIGPALLDGLVTKHGLGPLVRPWQTAFPIRPTDVVAMFLPDHAAELESRVTTADFVHLWNEIWHRMRLPKTHGPPEHSFLDALFRRFGFEFRPEARIPVDYIHTLVAEYELLSHLRAMLPPDSSLQQLDQMLVDSRAIVTSRSWRLTRPLRQAVDAWRGLRRGGRFR